MAETIAGCRALAQEVSVITGFNPTASEWFFYAPDGSRKDLIFAAPSDLASYGIHLPSGLDVSLHLEPQPLKALVGAVEGDQRGCADPCPVLDIENSCSGNQLACSGWSRRPHLAKQSPEMHHTLAEKLAHRAQVVSLDPGHYIKNLKPEQLAEILMHVTIFAPSEREVHEFRGPCDLHEAAKDFGQMGPKVVVIKIGMQGSIVFERDTGKFVQIPAIPTRTLDPTGCGDAFCGGFLAGFAETGNAIEAALCGTVSASLTV